MLCCLLIGFGRSAYSIDLAAFSVNSIPPAAVDVIGRVGADIERSVGSQRIVLEQVSYNAEASMGKLLVWVPLYPTIHFGDTLAFRCQVTRPEPIEGFAYDKFLRIRGIGAVCSQPLFLDVYPATQWSVFRGLFWIKEQFIVNLHRVLPEPHASFLAGLTLGGSSALPPVLKEDFTQTGLSHILAASGSNISLFSVVFLSFILSTGIGRRRGLILTLILLGAYVILAGASAAVVRAGLMGSLVVAQRWVCRKASVRNMCLSAATLMLLANPLVIHDVGFQLSFVATIAVMAFTKPVGERLPFIPEWFGVRESVAASMSAIVCTLPILLWQFGEISLIAPITNMLVLPFVPYAMAWTGIAALAGWVGGWFALVCAFPAWGLSHVMLTLVHVFGTLSFATVTPVHGRVWAVMLSFFFVWKLFAYASRRFS